MAGHLQKLWQEQRNEARKENKKIPKRRALNTRERGQPQHQQPGHYNFTVSMNHTNGVKDGPASFNDNVVPSNIGMAIVNLLVSQFDSYFFQDT